MVNARHRRRARLHDPLEHFPAQRAAPLSFFLIAIFSLYTLFRNLNGGSPTDITVPTPVTQEAASSVTTNDIPVTNTPPPEDNTPPQVTTNNAVASAPPVPTQAQTPPSSAPTQTGQYRDGQYVGSSADAYYGNVQVEVTIQHGQIANVQFLDYPRDRSTSYYINSQAMPELHTEAIQVQTAPVDGVSGATYTSQAFNQSLASALSQAKTHA